MPKRKPLTAKLGLSDKEIARRAAAYEAWKASKSGSNFICTAPAHRVWDWLPKMTCPACRDR